MLRKETTLIGYSISEKGAEIIRVFGHAQKTVSITIVESLISLILTRKWCDFESKRSLSLANEKYISIMIKNFIKLHFIEILLRRFSIRCSIKILFISFLLFSFTCPCYFFP